jgi:hypothetical protein
MDEESRVPLRVRSELPAVSLNIPLALIVDKGVL